MPAGAGVRLALLLTLAGLGCRRDAAPTPSVSSNPPTSESAGADASRLGREIFTLVDRAAEFRIANRGRAATSVRQLGIDSLTPEMARWVGVRNGRIVAGAAFRRTDGRAWISCEADEDALEEAALGGGRYELLCTDLAGERRTATADPAGPGE